MKFIGRMTVEIEAETAGEAIQAFMQPHNAKSPPRMIQIGVEPDYSEMYPEVAGPVPASLHPDPASPPVTEVHEPVPVPNEEVTEPEVEEEAVAEEQGCSDCPEPPTPMELPKDIPYHGTLNREGETLDSVILKVQKGTLGDVKGMGAAGVEKVAQYLRDTGRLPTADTLEDDALEPTEPKEVPDEPSKLEDVLGGSSEASEDSVTEEEVRKIMAAVAAKAKLPALKKLLESFGAGSLSELEEADYPAAYTAAQDLLNG